jgi:hypothetical protein
MQPRALVRLLLVTARDRGSLILSLRGSADERQRGSRCCRVRTAGHVLLNTTLTDNSEVEVTLRPESGEAVVKLR